MIQWWSASLNISLVWIIRSKYDLLTACGRHFSSSRCFEGASGGLESFETAIASISISQIEWLRAESNGQRIPPAAEWFSKLSEFFKTEASQTQETWSA